MAANEAKCSVIKEEKPSTDGKHLNCEHEFIVLKMLIGGLEEKTDKMNEEIALQHLMIDQFRKGIRREMQEKTNDMIKASTAALESRLDILEKENHFLREELQKAQRLEQKHCSSALKSQKSPLNVPRQIVSQQTAVKISDDASSSVSGASPVKTPAKKRCITKPKRFWEETEDGGSKTKREKK